MLLKKGRDVFKMMTLAPEQCSAEVIDFLKEHDILITAGHSNASYEDAVNGFYKGIPAATHLFNAMSPLQGREPGMVGAIYDHADVCSSIVCDGIHVDFASVRISKKIMQERLFLSLMLLRKFFTGSTSMYLKMIATLYPMERCPALH